MRRRRSNVIVARGRWRSSLVIAAQSSASRARRADNGRQRSRARRICSFPTGARALGMGQAVAARRPVPMRFGGTPRSSPARASREVAIQPCESVLRGHRRRCVVILPVQHAFTVGFSVRYIDEGQEDATSLDPNGTGGVFDISTASSRAAASRRRLAIGSPRALPRNCCASTSRAPARATPTRRRARRRQRRSTRRAVFRDADSTLSVAAVVSNVGFKPTGHRCAAGGSVAEPVRDSAYINPEVRRRSRATNVCASPRTSSRASKGGGRPGEQPRRRMGVAGARGSPDRLHAQRADRLGARPVASASRRGSGRSTSRAMLYGRGRDLRPLRRRSSLRVRMLMTRAYAPRIRGPASSAVRRSRGRLLSSQTAIPRRGRGAGASRRAGVGPAPTPVSRPPPTHRSRRS